MPAAMQHEEPAEPQSECALSKRDRHKIQNRRCPNVNDSTRRVSKLCRGGADAHLRWGVTPRRSATEGAAESSRGGQPHWSSHVLGTPLMGINLVARKYTPEERQPSISHQRCTARGRGASRSQRRASRGLSAAAGPALAAAFSLLRLYSRVVECEVRTFELFRGLLQIA